MLGEPPIALVEGELRQKPEAPPLLPSHYAEVHFTVAANALPKTTADISVGAASHYPASRSCGRRCPHADELWALLVWGSCRTAPSPTGVPAASTGLPTAS